MILSLNSIEVFHWLNCINYIFRNGKTLDELYVELLDRFVLEEELRQLQMDFIDSLIP